MAYLGTTSTAPNVPRLVTQGIGKTNRVWMYKSTHVQTDVSSTGFFRDGYALGMQLGDTVMVQSSTVYTLSMHTVAVRTSTGVGLSLGLLVSSAS